MTNKEREAAISKLVMDIKSALGKMPWRDEQLAAEALQRAVGTYKLRTMTEYLFSPRDEFDEEFAEGTFWETPKEAETDTTAQDF